MGGTVNLDVLFDRVERMYNDMRALDETVSELKTAVIDMRTLNTKLDALAEKISETLERQSEQQKTLDAHSAKLVEHATIWKITGSIVVISLSLVAWFYTSLVNLQEYDRQLDRRMMCIEIENRLHSRDAKPENTKGKQTDGKP